MAKELKVSGNYVIATDLILPNEILGQFPINHCVYRENDNSFIILEQIDNEVVTIDKAQVDAGEWVDEGSTPFTQATLLTFLRENTGFNTAGGGSPAIPEANLQLQCRLSPIIRQIYYEEIGFVNLTFIRTGIGSYTLQWDNSLLGGFSVMISNPYGTLSTFTGEQMYKTVISPTSISLKVVDQNGTLVDSGDFEVWIKFFAL